jgi:hypothetical protein
MGERGIEYIEAILLILIGLAIIALISGFLIQNISKIRFASACDQFDYLNIEDACISNSKPTFLYLFLSRPLQAKGNITFSLRIRNGYSKIIEFDNKTFFEYMDGNLYLADPNIKAGEGKGFVIFLDYYNISNFEEINVNVIKVDKVRENCSFGQSFKIKNCSNLIIKSIPNLTSNKEEEQEKILFLPI